MIKHRVELEQDLNYLQQLIHEGDTETALKRIPIAISDLLETLIYHPEKVVNSYKLDITSYVIRLEEENKELNKKVEALEKIIHNALSRKEEKGNRSGDASRI